MRRWRSRIRRRSDWNGSARLSHSRASGCCRSRLDRAEETLLAAPADLLRGHDRRLAAASELLLSYSVERVLRRGFAVVRRGGEALRSAEGLSPGDRLDITLADGEVQAAVVACTKKKR